LGVNDRAADISVAITYFSKKYLGRASKNLIILTIVPACGILPTVSGWVRRGGILQTPSDPRGSSGKRVILGAAG